MTIQRESIDFDVVIVGGGPAGLAAAIRLKQGALAQGAEISVCLVDKAAEIGAHTLSGAILDPSSLGALFPERGEGDFPVGIAVSEDRFLWLSERHSVRIPSFLLPECLRNEGNLVVSLGGVCRWLAEQAESLGVEIFTGFAATEVLFDSKDAVRGVATGDLGRLKDGSEGPNFQPGIELLGKYTFFAEGARGTLGKRLAEHYGLREGCAPQIYGLGIKELWEVPPAQSLPGLVIHSCAWPLRSDTYGGGFLYHVDKQRVAVGLVVGLGYRNPYLSPFEEFQRFKTHPEIRRVLLGGRRIAYGANSVVSGGIQSLPKLAFPGGVLVGDEAGFLNPARSKGAHAAITSGMLAAEAALAALLAHREHDLLAEYPQAFRCSGLYEELWSARNFKPWLNKGLYLGGALFGIEQKLFGGKSPWTLAACPPDHLRLEKAAACAPIHYPKPDGVLTFDRASSVFLSNIRHEENQPCHLHLKDPEVPLKINLAEYDAPEQRYCPAGVYEILHDANAGEARLQINAQNCLHCRSCDIKDPTQNIEWVPPQGGDGPSYPNL